LKLQRSRYHRLFQFYNLFNKSTTSKWLDVASTFVVSIFNPCTYTSLFWSYPESPILARRAPIWILVNTFTTDLLTWTGSSFPFEQVLASLSHFNSNLNKQQKPVSVQSFRCIPVAMFRFLEKELKLREPSA
jgi:hypothetical protein